MGVGHNNYRTPAIRTTEEIGKIEKACRIVADTLSLLENYIKPGVTTLELDKIAEDYIKSKNAVPAFKGYQVDDKYFPNTLCISVDEEVVHGIPGKRVLVEGEIVSLDCGAQLDGYFGDSAYTYAVGEISEEKKRLMKVTQESLMLGIEQAVDRNKVYDIGRAIQNYCEKNGYTLTRELVGHGVGKNLHEEPSIPNFVPALLHRTKFPNVKLYSGMGLAIEPMVQMGGVKVTTLKDGWTVVTADKKPAAHFEHTVIVNNNHPLILTLR